MDEVAKEKDSGIVRLRVNAKFFRPTEVDQLLGDPTKAKTKLGWQPKVYRAPDTECHSSTAFFNASFNIRAYLRTNFAMLLV